jgi:hypothetical protein
MRKLFLVIVFNRKDIFNKFRLHRLLVFLLLLNAGCGTYGVVVTGGSGGGPAPEPAPRPYPSYHSLHIPPGHLPPPGECRIWYPGRPPGHQPPPVSCAVAINEAPAGSWVLHRNGNEPDILEVKEKKGGKPQIEIIISYYQID